MKSNFNNLEPLENPFFQENNKNYFLRENENSPQLE